MAATIDYFRIKHRFDAVEGLAFADRCIVPLRRLMLWRALRQVRHLERDIDQLEREMLAKPADTEIDPEDKLTDDLLRMQRKTRRLLRLVAELRERHPGPAAAGSAALLAELDQKLRSAHEAIGRVRTIILEHDADASGAGPEFDNVEDLISYLRDRAAR